MNCLVSKTCSCCVYMLRLRLFRNFAWTCLTAYQNLSPWATFHHPLQFVSTFVTGTAARVLLLNGARPCNIFYVVRTKLQQATDQAHATPCYHA